MRLESLPEGSTRQRLETWGEIASYLGVEIRTAQRWEARMGLPVRRIDGGQAVFAFSDELESWRDSREIRRPEAPTVAAVQPSIPVEPSARRSLSRKHLVLWAVSVLLAAVAGFVAAFWSLAASVSNLGSEPQKLVLEGNRLLALDALDRVQWVHDFNRETMLIDTAMRPNLPVWWKRVDIGRDGSSEFVVVLKHAHPERGSETLYCFSARGELRYSYQPDFKMDFRQRSFSGLWRFWAFDLVDGEDGLWAAIEHAGEWATAVVRVASDGKGTMWFAQPGLIRALKSFQYQGRGFVLAGGVNNEYGAATLALIDPRSKPSTAPQTGTGPFTCLNCPEGKPLKYLVFTPSPLNVADGRPYNLVHDLNISEEGISLSTYEGELARIWYRLTPDLIVTSATPSDAYWSWHPDTNQSWSGRVRHPREISVRTWNAADWTSRAVPFTGLERSVLPVP